ncbi:MAG: hypothetical protein IPN34_24220 [Planctomycetes bacterium]|nr:hypothetical protein [Planctomycetota bacterium]
MSRTLFSLAGVSAAALAALAPAQDLGRGLLQANGVEPRLELEGAAPGRNAWIRARALDVDPQAPPLVYLLLSADSMAIPLDGLGLFGAVLGVGPTGFWNFGPIPVTSQGTFDLPVLVHPAWRGATIHAQLLVLDPRIGALPVALSDSRSMTIGADGAELVMLQDAAAPGTQHFVRHFADGLAGTPLPLLRDLVPVDLVLASASESHAFRDDRARIERIAGVATLRLADGGRVIRYRRAGSTTFGLAHILPSGRAEIVYESSFVAPGHDAIDALVAVSSFGPYLSFAVNEGWTRVLVYRTDGANLAGSPSPLRDLTPSGATLIEPGAMVFGSSVLVFVDDVNGPYRARLDGSSAVQRFVLPPSGGGTPTNFDEELAVSGDGRVFAFGAGLGRRSKDIYALRDDGSAVNVTQSPADYSEVGYTNLGRRLEIALNLDGSLVSYVNNSTPEPEGYLRGVSSPVLFHLTSTQTFVDSIDVGGVGQLPYFGGALVIAGLDEQSLDFYYTPTGAPQQLVNLTNTGSPGQPFGLGSALALNDLGTLASAPQLLISVRDARVQRDTLLALDLQAGTSRLVADPVDGPSLALSGTEAALASGNELVFARPGDPTTGYRRAVALGAPARLLARTGTTVYAAVGALSTSRVLWRFDAASGTGAPLDPQAAAIDDLVVDQVSGSALTLRAGVLYVTDALGATQLRGGAALRAVLSRG